MATTTPLRRVYFDSNVLHNWPNVTNELWNALSAARWLGSELYIPETVEDELQAQFISGVQNAYDAIDGQVLLDSRRVGAGSNPDASPKTCFAPKSVQMRFVGSLEEGHFYTGSFLRLICRKPA